MSLKIERYDLVEHGRVLATRATGRDVGRTVAERLAAEPGLLMSFYGVDVASPAFLVELIGAVRAIRVTAGDRWLLLTGMNEDVRESVELVLDRLKVSLGNLQGEQIELLGGTKQLEDTLREAQQLGTFTAPELAERLEMKLPALHQRLNRLLESGLLIREDDPTATRGKRGKYTAAPSEDADHAGDRQDTGEITAISVG
jgi:hypothetical protein